MAKTTLAWTTHEGPQIKGAREILADQLRGGEVSFRGVEIADQNGVVLKVVGISEILRGPR
jgi:hypothetical protein